MKYIIESATKYKKGDLLLCKHPDDKDYFYLGRVSMTKPGFIYITFLDGDKFKYKENSFYIVGLAKGIKKTAIKPNDISKFLLKNTDNTKTTTFKELIKLLKPGYNIKIDNKELRIYITLPNRMIYFFSVGDNRTDIINLYEQFGVKEIHRQGFDSASKAYKEWSHVFEPK